MVATIASKATLVQRVRDVIAGTLKHSPNGSLTFGGYTFAVDALVKVLQGLADALAKADTAKANWKEALKEMRDVRATVRPILGSYRTWLVATYGNAPATLSDYGMTPRKVRTPQTTEQKAAAAALRKATRTARHTMGAKQKKGIKATAPATKPVDGAVQEPAKAPSTATPPATAPKLT